MDDGTETDKATLIERIARLERENRRSQWIAVATAAACAACVFTVLYLALADKG